MLTIRIFVKNNENLNCNCLSSVQFIPISSSVQFSSVYYLSSNTGTSFKIKCKIQINPYE